MEMLDESVRRRELFNASFVDIALGLALGLLPLASPEIGLTLVDELFGYKDQMVLDHDKVDEVALLNTDLAADLGGYGHLAIPSDFGQCHYLTPW
jgi:hypothetical protein